jgi:hypothetical protein
MEPLGTPPRPWRLSATCDPHGDAPHQEQTEQARIVLGSTIRVASPIPLAGFDLSTELLDLRKRVEPFPPALMPPALHTFLGLDRGHRCPPSGLS